MDLYIIAEIGINHNGSVDIAKSLIEKSAAAGCNAVKFQKRDINSVYSAEELDAPRNSPWGTTNRQQKEGLEFSIDQYKELYKYTKEFNMDFGVSCWDLKSVDLIESNLNIDFHKVASAMLTNKDFLLRLNSTQKNVIISTGMTSESDIDKSINVFGSNLKYILACTSTYPTKPAEVNLNHIKTLKEKYPTSKIGFSNHYNGLEACLGAVAAGAECLEFHVTLDKTMYGSDQSASIENIKELVSGSRLIQEMLGSGQKTVYDSEVPIQSKLRKINNL